MNILRMRVFFLCRKQVANFHIAVYYREVLISMMEPTSRIPMTSQSPVFSLLVRCAEEFTEPTVSEARRCLDVLSLVAQPVTRSRTT